MVTEKSLGFIGLPTIFPAVILMAANVVVLELGRRGLWNNQGAGFSPWYPVCFGIIHLIFWPIKICIDRLYVDQSCRWWRVFFAVVLMILFLLYNCRSIQEIMYVT